MRRLLVVLAAVLAVLAPSAPAWAHAQLISADPAKDATLAKAPTAVTLVFSEQLNPDFTTIVVSDTARQRIAAADPVVDGVNGTLTLSQALGNGVYTVAYRVVSNDGHTVQGSYTFTVADPSAPAPASAAPSSTVEAAAPSTGSGGIPGGVLIGLAVLGVLLAALAAYFYFSGRRKPAASPRP